MIRVLNRVEWGEGVDDYTLRYLREEEDDKLFKMWIR